MKIILERYSYCDKQTLGMLFLMNDDHTILNKYYTLELPNRDNRRRISCIPEGEYIAVKHRSPKYKKCFWIQDVPNRSEILIHKGNYYFDILGCILIGSDLRDLNKDGLQDVVNSSKSVLELFNAVKQDRIELKIVKV
jgi:hypothetical protein